ncbi:MAG: alpha/beta-hydrolase family protein [Candidatus Nanopelagicales bacterium]
MDWRLWANRGWTVGRRLLTTEVSTVEAAGLLHGMASIGPSFDKSLLPRTTIQQAGATGTISTLNYALTTTQQSFLEAFANRVVGSERLDRRPLTRRAVILAADLAGIGVGLAAQRILRQKPDESLLRATARTAAHRGTSGAMAGAVAIGIDGAYDTAARNATPGTVNAPIVIAIGATAGAAVHLARSHRLLDTASETDQYGDPVRSASYVQPIRAMVVGGGVSLGLYVSSRIESLVAGGIAAGVRWAVPPLAPAAGAIGHAAALGGVAIALERAISYVNDLTETAGNAIEPAYRSRPVSELVSGGTNSGVDWNTIGREGRRFVNMTLTASEIQEVTGKPAVDPIRVFVGYDSAESPNARAYLAMAELERMGAFERPYIAIYSPTGSGYVNYVAAETTEFLTGGDCAGVCIQYSVRPSFLSLDRVGTAWESSLALLTALAWRVRSIPEARRPKILLFGESLGSQSAQDVFEKEGVAGFDILSVDRAVFVGSPYGSRWRRRWLRDPAGMDPEGLVVEVASPREFAELPRHRRDAARAILLTHDEDPIPKFGPRLAVQRPDWLTEEGDRPAGVPPDMRYWPLFTFLLVGIDLLNADHVIPGKFDAFAHDYRKDIPEMIRLGFDLPTDDATMARIEKALRKREADWAERRVVFDNLEKAEESIRAKLGDWGIDHKIVPNLVTPEREITADPYEVVTAQ